MAAELAGPAANPGRGSYPWSTAATKRVEAVRAQAARFVGASSPEEVVFTSGATASLNAVALAWGLPSLRDGDEILYGPHDHVSNVYPWFRLRDLLARSGVRIGLVPYRITRSGMPDVADLLGKVSPRTRLITVTHLHGLFGSLAPVGQLRDGAGASVRICLDCSQSGGHLPLNLTGLGVDFAAFSAQKMFGLSGVGMAYFRAGTHAGLGPFLPGGTGGGPDTSGAPGTVTMPGDLEAGTANVTGIVALGAALTFLAEAGVELVAAHQTALTAQLVSRLRGIRPVRFLPGPGAGDDKAGHGIVSFQLDGARSADVGFALGQAGFYVRAGRNCQPPDSPFADSVRVSMDLYNSGHEIDRLADHLSSLVSEV